MAGDGVVDPVIVVGEPKVAQGRRRQEMGWNGRDAGGMAGDGVVDPVIVRPVVDATSWTFSSQLMKLISGSMSRVCLIVSVVALTALLFLGGWWFFY